MVFKDINVLHLESSLFQNFRCGISWSVRHNRKDATQKKLKTKTSFRTKLTTNRCCYLTSKKKISISHIFFKVKRFSLECRKVISFASTTLRDWPKKKTHTSFSSNQRPVKAEPIVTRSFTFSRPLRQSRVFASTFDWFTVLSATFMIFESKCFGFGFTTPIGNRSNVQRW